MTKPNVLKLTSSTNVFVMMRYRDDSKFGEIENAIRASLLQFGLTARLAKDGAVQDHIWANIVAYMTSSSLGIAVFEELEQRDVNPNVSLELGYMLALERRCLLLKDRRVSALQTDMCGRIYRSFDPDNIHATVSEQVARWCLDDLGLQLMQKRPPMTELERWIGSNLDRGTLTTRPSFPAGVHVIFDEFEDGESKYVIWNEISQRLYKYYQAGVSWSGPHPLNERELDSVCERIGAPATVQRRA